MWIEIKWNNYQTINVKWNIIKFLYKKWKIKNENKQKKNIEHFCNIYDNEFVK